MRDWSLAANERRYPASKLVDCLGRLGSLEIQRDFHELMIDLHANPKLDLAFGACDLPGISESEAIMLALWSDGVRPISDTGFADRFAANCLDARRLD